MLFAEFQIELEETIKKFKNYQQYNIETLEELIFDLTYFQESLEDYEQCQITKKNLSNFINKVNYRIRVLSVNYNDKEYEAIDNLIKQSISNNDLEDLKNVLNENPIDLSKEINFYKYIYMLEMNDENYELDVIKILIDYGLIINGISDCGNTPLNLAIKWNKIKIIKLLIDEGADINAQDSLDNSPLHMAVKQNNIEIVQMLINLGANISLKNECGLTPLLWTLEQETDGSFEIARLLIDNTSNIKCQENDQFSLFYIAIMNNNLLIAQFLLDAGADINIKTPWGDTPLHSVIKHRCMEPAQFLINQGANINEQDIKGNTALHLAILEGNRKLVEYIIKHSHYDLDIKNDDGLTPLQLALHNNELRIMQILITKIVKLKTKNVKNYFKTKLATDEQYKQAVKTIDSEKGIELTSFQKLTENDLGINFDSNMNNKDNPDESTEQQNYLLDAIDSCEPSTSSDTRYQTKRLSDIPEMSEENIEWLEKCEDQTNEENIEKTYL